MALVDGKELLVWSWGKVSLSRFGKELEQKHGDRGMGFSNQLDFRIFKEENVRQGKEC